MINSNNKKEKLRLLEGVTGYFNPGEMGALMGCELAGAGLWVVALWALVTGRWLVGAGAASWVLPGGLGWLAGWLLT